MPDTRPGTLVVASTEKKKTLFIREDFIFALIRESKDMRK